jgi:predicted Zn-dependent peptidase
MNSTQYRQARHTEFRIAMDAYYAVARNNDATTEELTAAANARTWADREWINAQHIANQMAQAELDAATAKGCEEVVEVVAEVTAAEVIANINTNEAFGTAWGADGEVLTYEQTTAAIDAGRGWFDRQGRWVNKAGWEKQNAHLSAWVIAKLAN